MKYCEPGTAKVYFTTELGREADYLEALLENARVTKKHDDAIRACFAAAESYVRFLRLAEKEYLDKLKSPLPR